MYDFVIETNRLTKAYSNQLAVNNVNLHLKERQIYGLIGRNGAGKTPLMKLLLGLLPATKGEVRVFGKSIKGNEKLLYPHIGAMIENPGFYPNLTGKENLEIFAKLRGLTDKTAVKKALEKAELPYESKKIFANYSLGMKQRLGIANALLHNPALLILDEPTNGLDPVGISKLRTFLKTLSTDCRTTILVSSHILSEVSLLADHIGILHQGNLVEECSMAALKEKHKDLWLKENALEQYFKTLTGGSEIV